MRTMSSAAPVRSWSRPRASRPSASCWSPSWPRRSPNDQAGVDPAEALALGGQALRIEWQSAHVEVTVPRQGPLLARAVPIELDAVLIDVAQIERLSDAVIAGAVERDAGRD